MASEPKTDEQFMEEIVSALTFSEELKMTFNYSKVYQTIDKIKAQARENAFMEAAQKLTFMKNCLPNEAKTASYQLSSAIECVLELIIKPTHAKQEG